MLSHQIEKIQGERDSFRSILNHREAAMEDLFRSKMEVCLSVCLSVCVCMRYVHVRCVYVSVCLCACWAPYDDILHVPACYRVVTELKCMYVSAVYALGYLLSSSLSHLLH